MADVTQWTALEKVIREEERGDFMFMGETGAETTIYLYKHVNTRRYLNLDLEGQAYEFRAGKYEPILLSTALLHVFGKPEGEEKPYDGFLYETRSAYDGGVC